MTRDVTTSKGHALEQLPTPPERGTPNHYITVSPAGSRHAPQPAIPGQEGSFTAPMFMLLDKHRRTIFITVTVTFLVASLFALGRVVSRFGIARRHGWDDYVFIVAWVRRTARVPRPRLTLSDPRFWAIFHSRVW